MRRSLLAVPAALLLGLTGACGTTAPAATDPASEEAGSGGGEAVSVVDDRGETVELDAPAEEVVALEWGLAENLVALGVMPVGVADVEGFGTWNDAVELDEGVVDVGTRGEPSVDAIIGLDPELVVTTTDLPETIINQLEDVGLPVVALKGSNADDPLGHLERTVDVLAEATGTVDKGEQLLADLDATIQDGRAALAEAGLEDAKFAMADGWQDGGAVSIRMFTQGSLLGALAGELGLVNAWEGEGDAVYGLQSTDVEGLTQLGDVHFLYIANDSAQPDPFTEGLAGNAVWNGLPFVEAGNVHRLPDGIWMFGGPRSAEQYVTAVVEALTA
ncbi:siderophore ABC transporter substrate-binding protein CdtB [Georgenia halophila]|uniref:Siderophore ABC transporter substrate-binding protein CdtB n=1 Tax=Georgenia halophila TaxID=620889 RepID=A0ABP8L6N2_9MICO